MNERRESDAVSDRSAGLRPACPTVADAARQAGWLEATAPKVGNVHPGASFDDLRYEDFCVGAEILGEELADAARPLADRMYRVVQQTARRCHSNVNLGIVLLIGPLFEAVRTRRTPNDILNAFTLADGGRVMRAIAIAGAGGLGESSQMDVHESQDDVDILEAMAIAQDRDRIARQYTHAFADVVDVVEPMLAADIGRRGDISQGIVETQIRLLAMWPDSLIVRKCGLEVAESVRRRAAATDPADPDAVRALDAHLRSPSHRLNPGTTADLIAAGLFWWLSAPMRA